MSFMKALNNVVASRPAMGKHANNNNNNASEGSKDRSKSKSGSVKDIKCVVVGDGGVGKTSMLLAYTIGTFMADYTPTVFDTFAVTMDVGDQQCNVGLYDTAGQETYDNLRSLVYYDTDVFIVCFSVIRPDSFDNVRTRWIPELKLYRPKCHIVLVGTQIDLREEKLLGSPSMTSINTLGTSNICDSTLSLHASVNHTLSCVTKRHGIRLATKVGADGYYECSALTHVGLANVFEKTVATYLKPKRHVKLWRNFKTLVRKRHFSRRSSRH